MNEENVVHLHSETLLSSKKQWQLEICMQMDGSSELTKTQKDEHGMYSLISGGY